MGETSIGNRLAVVAAALRSRVPGNLEHMQRLEAQISKLTTEESDLREPSSTPGWSPKGPDASSRALRLYEVRKEKAALFEQARKPGEAAINERAQFNKTVKSCWLKIAATDGPEKAAAVAKLKRVSREYSVRERELVPLLSSYTRIQEAVFPTLDIDTSEAGP